MARNERCHNENILFTLVMIACFNTNTLRYTLYRVYIVRYVLDVIVSGLFDILQCNAFPTVFASAHSSCLDQYTQTYPIKYKNIDMKYSWSPRQRVGSLYHAKLSHNIFFKKLAQTFLISNGSCVYCALTDICKKNFRLAQHLQIIHIETTKHIQTPRV